MMGAAQRSLSLYRRADLFHTIPQNGTEAIFYGPSIGGVLSSLWASIYRLAAANNENTNTSSANPWTTS
jgi:hypothetical protein